MATCKHCPKEIPDGALECNPCWAIYLNLSRPKAAKFITVQLDPMPSVPGSIGTVLPAGSGQFTGRDYLYPRPNFNDNVYLKGSVTGQRTLDLPCKPGELRKFLGD